MEKLMKGTTLLALSILMFAASGCGTTPPASVASPAPERAIKVEVKDCSQKTVSDATGTYRAQYCNLVTAAGRTKKVWLIKTPEGIEVRMAGGESFPPEGLAALPAALPASDIVVYVGSNVQPPQGWTRDSQLGFIRYDHD
jgi:hypothetical protein